MAKNNLKAWIKYDNNKRIVPGTLLLRAKRPPSTTGTWVQVPSTLCCFSQVEIVPVTPDEEPE